MSFAGQFAQPGDTHRCPVPGCCIRTVPSRYLMCGVHWNMVPQALGTLIWREYFSGMRRKNHPTPAYTKAVAEALRIVAERITPTRA